MTKYIFVSPCCSYSDTASKLFSMRYGTVSTSNGTALSTKAASKNVAKGGFVLLHCDAVQRDVKDAP